MHAIMNGITYVAGNHAFSIGIDMRFAHLFFAFTWYNRIFLFTKLFDTFSWRCLLPLGVNLTRFGDCLTRFGGCLPSFGVWLARLLVWLGPFGVWLTQGVCVVLVVRSYSLCVWRGRSLLALVVCVVRL